MEQLLERIITEIDNCISNQLSMIMSDNALCQLESSWRSLWLLCEKLPKDINIACKLFDISWNEVREDALKCIEFDQSNLFQKIYSLEFDHPGGHPYGLLIADYYLTGKSHNSHKDNDYEVYKHLSQISAASFAPLVIGVDISFFGIDDISDIYKISSFSTMINHHDYNKYKVLRAQYDSRFLSLSFPRIKIDRISQNIKCPVNKYYSEKLNISTLWGNSAFAFAILTIKHYSTYNYFTNMRGSRFVLGIEQEQHQNNSKTLLTRGNLEIDVTYNLENALNSIGIMTLSYIKNTNQHAYFSCNSVKKITTTAEEDPNSAHSLSIQLPYLLCISRFAHYIKCLGREKIGSYQTSHLLERMLQKWLLEYTATIESDDSELNYKYPLKESKVSVFEKYVGSGEYSCKLYLQPRCQFNEVSVAMLLVTNL